MITLDVARAHVDELQRVAAAYNRTHAKGRGRRRLLARRIRRH
jgi:hypothetical protein